MAEKPTVNTQIASQLRGVYFGGNWTWVNLKEHLTDISWHQATAQVADLNTIAGLVFHLQFYTSAIIEVLEGKPLTVNDKESWTPPSISSQKDWDKLLEEFWNKAEELAALIEKLPESKFLEKFDDGKFGNYYRNIHGVIEHLHYHMGQIVLIKKILAQKIEAK